MFFFVEKLFFLSFDMLSFCNANVCSDMTTAVVTDIIALFCVCYIPSNVRVVVKSRTSDAVSPVPTD